MEGYAALTAWRDLPECIPVVFLSAGVRAGTAGMPSEADGYLAKPIRVDEIPRLVAGFYLEGSMAPADIG